ncbi:MAG: hypothetical protein IK062_02150, partial [Selenomonadaceae bacterium]|nr:hypothetical protein [Selenomonadaceae bacterium]
MYGGQKNGRLDRTHEFPHAGVPQQRFIEAERPENEYGKGRVRKNEPAERLPVPDRINVCKDEIKTHPEREKIRRAYGYKIICAEQESQTDPLLSRMLLCRLFPFCFLLHGRLFSPRRSFAACSAVFSG